MVVVGVHAVISLCFLLQLIIGCGDWIPKNVPSRGVGVFIALDQINCVSDVLDLLWFRFKLLRLDFVEELDDLCCVQQSRLVWDWCLHGVDQLQIVLVLKGTSGMEFSRNFGFICLDHCHESLSNET